MRRANFTTAALILAVAFITGGFPRMSEASPDTARATLGGGCFWCLEAVFEQVDGVQSVVSGYAGGHVADPGYKEVCSGRTGHAEVVQITYDPQKVSYEQLLTVFFGTHDPTTLNRQGADTGTQYRSIILTANDEQKQAAETLIRRLEQEKVFDDPIVTEVVPLQRFYRAEDYHQDYYRNNPGQGYCQVVIAPKLAKFRKEFADQLAR